MAAWFVTFEGLDGSGKSTHLRTVADRLAQAGVDLCRTHEPGGTPFGEKVRSLFLGADSHGVDGLVEVLLVFASRRQHLVEVIEPQLERGTHVLCDRFTDSTFAYQAYGRKLSPRLVDRIDELATGRRCPDRTVLFDLPAAEARRRGSSGRRRRDGETDRLDDEDLAFYERVREGFLTRAAAEPERFRVVSSAGAPAETATQVVEALADLFPELGPEPAS